MDITGVGVWESLSELTWSGLDGSGGCRVFCGDNRDILPKLPSGSVDLVVTSPPYFGQRVYGDVGVGNEEVLEDYLEQLMIVFEEVVRVVKESGNIVYNVGDRVLNGSYLLVPHRFALRVLDRGWEGLRLVNEITWVKTNPTPHQFGRRLVASTEPFYHFALGGGYYYDRDAFLPGPGAAPNIPGPILGNKYRQLIDQSDLSLAERTAAHAALDQVVGEVRAGKFPGFRMKIRGVHAPAYGGQGGGRQIQMEREGFTVIRLKGEPMKRSVIESRVEMVVGGVHPAVFPVSVVRELVRLLCPHDGLVMDPYMGSGSTLLAALEEGRRCVGLEVSERYCGQAEASLKLALGRPRLF